MNPSDIPNNVIPAERGEKGTENYNKINPPLLLNFQEEFKAPK